MARFFQPIRGTEEKILAYPQSEGNFYVCTDTRKIYMDTKDGERIPIGGAGNSGIYYGLKTLTEEEKEATEVTFTVDDLEGDTIPSVDDLILNQDGSFFRVIEIREGKTSVQAKKLTVSGSGSGGGDEYYKSLYFTIDYDTTNLINGKDFYITLNTHTAIDKDKQDVDRLVTISWELSYTENGTTYISSQKGQFDINNGELDETTGVTKNGIEKFNIGQYARENMRQRLTMVASEANYTTKVITRTFDFTTSELSLTLNSRTSNANVFDVNSCVIYYNHTGNMSKILDVYFDGKQIGEPINLPAQSEDEKSINFNTLTQVTHGYHTIKLVLSQNLNGDRGLSVDPIEFEIATKKTGDNTPIIWLQPYKSSYYNYDPIQIYFNVYDGQNTANPTVTLYKDNKPTSTRTIQSTGFQLWEITDGDVGMQNSYAISCGSGDYEARRELSFLVEEDPNRKDYHIETDSLLLSFDASGRSNSESAAQRSTWTYSNGTRSYAGEFKDFNWYNNGWITDKSTGKTCLRISNGASFEIPVDEVIFGDAQNAAIQSNTIEFQLKIRNIQNYNNLIRNITRYQNDDTLYGYFNDPKINPGYTNYDSFLSWYLKNHEYKDNKDNVISYDDLQFARIDKVIDSSNIVAKLAAINGGNVIGVCLGPQDALFSNGVDTVNVSYVENEIITVSAVYQHAYLTSDTSSATTGLMFIYVNGVLTGVCKNTRDPQKFTIGNGSNKIILSSNYCDIDLYKIRLYNKALNVCKIINNYAVDANDVSIYDLNQLATENGAIKEYQFNYNNMINYNSNHISSPIMPYVIFDATQATDGKSDKLSFSKKNKIEIDMDFVNTPLEYAYNSGELIDLAIKDGLCRASDDAQTKEEAAKKYYIHHCPSFTTRTNTENEDGSGKVSMAVQGTSSEFYPRRNYKVKTKTSNGVQIYCNRGPFSDDYVKLTQTLPEDEGYADAVKAVHQDWFYMNNYTCGTTKFTMKIDFMESSGTYNMGFANLVNNAYTHHPLEDYKQKGGLAKGELVVDTANPIDPSTIEAWSKKNTYYYYNKKGNLKYVGEDADGLNFVKGQEVENLKLGPLALAAAQNVSKIGTDNHWYLGQTVYNTIKSDDAYTFTDYRTSVQGFRVLAFWKRSSGNYQYIGMYNMLIDKGSDECYGFKPSKTMETDIYAPYVKNKKMDKIAECWEFSDNTRTYCSYRDPLQRDKLSFDNFTETGGQFTRQLNALGCAPMVCDSFEYRYNDAADLLDYIYDNTSFQESPDASVPTWSDSTSKANLTNNKDDERAAVTFDLYKNWEKACQWVWSTCTDIEGLAQNSYTQVSLAEKLWEANKYYIYDSNISDYVLDSGSAFNDSYTYYIKAGTTKDPVYESVVLTDNPDNLYVKDKYYTMEKVGSNESYFISTGAFDSSAVYYKAQLAENMEGAKPLIKPAEGEYQEGTQYYTYDWTKRYSECVQKVTITKEEYNANPGKYYVQTSVTYGSQTYNYDTKEYRLMKFQYELPLHFNIEYMATYFVMTEVFECYDSRGKNCMMASWGPQKEGGEYIWYPIFYDIDTQLGINNTGIPSFEYNVDATIDGNFSTSDSVLWNNFYTCFKGTEIINKYRNLKGINSTYASLKNPPIVSVDNIEGWYTSDPKTCNQIVMRGLRPLVAKDLDEFYKYISITNPAGKVDGVTGYIDSSDTGNYTTDPNGLYFYALQGDRSLSRRQFLTNRIEYIDSWLNEGNYKRGGTNRVRGRIAANSTDGNLSDIWIETDSDPYWQDAAETFKSHQFDGEYWINFQPVRSSYVTVVTDNEAFPSKKYNGINPVKFTVPSIERGVRKSLNYPEQLFYLQGVNQMSSFGDLSKIYYTEFAFEGEAGAPYLTDLRLGYDGLMVDEKTGKIVEFEKIDNTKLAVKLPSGKYAMRWYNGNMKYPGIPAGVDSGIGMPLLKEVNLCNINLTSTTGQVNTSLDFSGCEKLENFRATGSNLTQIKFAQGVALNTLYMPSSTSTLTLVEARQLKDLIKSEDYEYPTYDVRTKKLTAKKGLYIEGLFDTPSSADKLQSIKFANIGLGINSYVLIKHWYDELMTEFATKPSQISYKLTLTDSNWSPYVQVGKTDSYDESKTYVKDNSQYGFETYAYTDLNTWKVDTGNGEIYEKTLTDTSSWVIKDINMLKDFISNNKVTFVDVDNENNIPNISGIIYIENDEPVDEAYIRNEIQPKFPNLTFFFKNVTKGKTIRYLLKDDDGKLYQQVGIKTYYNNDKEVLNPKLLNETVSPMKQNYDFYGWSFTSSTDDICVSADGTTKDNWTNKLDEFIVGADTLLTIYAVFTIHKWNITWSMPNGQTITKITHGEFLSEPDTNSDYAAGYSYILPYKDSNALIKEKAYSFTGWSLREDGAPIQLSLYRATKDYTLYAQFEQMNVRDENYDYLKNPDRYFELARPASYSDSGDLNDSVAEGMGKYADSKYTVLNGCYIKAKTGVKLQGKVTIPSIYNSMAVIGIAAYGFANQDQVTHYFFANKSNLRRIGSAAFRSNTSLQYFDFPEGLRTMDHCGQDSTFDNSTEWSLVEGLVFPDSLIAIGKGVFQGSFKQTNIGSIKFGDNLMYLGSQAFRYCDGLSGVTIQIGTSNSKLMLSKGTTQISEQDGQYRFPMNDQTFGVQPAEVQFYTKNYLSLDTVITPDEGTLKPYTVEQYFGNNINVTLKNGR